MVQGPSAGSLCDKLKQDLNERGRTSVADDLEANSEEPLCALHGFCPANTEDALVMEDLRKRQHQSGNSKVPASSLAQTNAGKSGNFPHQRFVIGPRWAVPLPLDKTFAKLRL